MKTVKRKNYERKMFVKENIVKDSGSTTYNNNMNVKRQK